MPLRPYMDTMYDEEEGVTLFIQYVCACGCLDFVAGNGFACAHCDSVCKKKNCELCDKLNAVDYFAEEGDEDSDI